MATGNNVGFVRVMRSHDYNQFEVCLPLQETFGLPVHPEFVNALRKDAARLVDAAVRDYDRMKEVVSLAQLMAGDLESLRQDAEDILTVPVERRSPAQKAVLNKVKDYDFFSAKNFQYDYSDDYQDDELTPNP